MKTLIIIPAVLIAACAANPEAIKARTEYRQEFLAEKQLCEAQGGVMVMDGHVHRDVPPTGTDYWCT